MTREDIPLPTLADVQAFAREYARVLFHVLPLMMSAEEFMQLCIDHLPPVIDTYNGKGMRRYTADGDPHREAMGLLGDVILNTRPDLVWTEYIGVTYGPAGVASDMRRRYPTLPELEEF